MSNTSSVESTYLSTFALTSIAKGILFISSKEELQFTVRKLVSENTPFAVLGGGSNSLLAPYIDKILLIIDIPGINYEPSNQGASVTAGAGVSWDDFVEDTIRKGYSGLESLSAIPGKVGAAPIQNIGAYGMEASKSIICVDVYDIQKDIFTSFTKDECGFGYRTSNFKTKWSGKYIIVGVSFLVSNEKYCICNYPAVRAVFPDTGLCTPEILRKIIVEIRWSKLPKPEKLSNLGSFFHNPVVSQSKADILREQFPGIPLFSSEQMGMHKVSAGWLIDQCGWKGKRKGSIGVYDKNALVIVNYGGATLSDVLAFQRFIEESVQDKFGITLIREPSIIE
jgi:UDP-N-acetylmuramate dehydrogenase